MSKSDGGAAGKTPRTDAVLQCGEPVDAKLMTIARQLETELAEAKGKLLVTQMESEVHRLGWLTEQAENAEFKRRINDGELVPVDDQNWLSCMSLTCTKRKRKAQEFAKEKQKG